MYLENFVQALFDSVDLKGKAIVVGGDGRYYNDVAIQTILRLAAGNGLRKVYVAHNGLMSTPAVSACIRARRASDGSQECAGGIILTASHNPGGPEDDFGIKYNGENGGPASEKITNAIYERTQSIDKVRQCSDLPAVDLAAKGTVHRFGDGAFEVEVIDSCEDYCAVVLPCFDMEAIKGLLARKDFSFVYDAMHGVAGVYAQRIFVEELGADPSSLMRCDSKADFGGAHPDPNLTYAPELVKKMGLQRDGTPLPAGDCKPEECPVFGAAADGDGDRNMVLGRQFFVTPSDSVAVLAAHASSIKQFREGGGLRGAARSMPTSQALDAVCAARGIRCFEVPTGWKFFGNLMDSKEVFGKEDYTPFLCGEESFGTGSSHIREKDGLWAVLAWLSVLADANKDTKEGALVGVGDVLGAFWGEFGRNYYRRYDFEGVESEGANSMMEHLRGLIGDEGKPAGAAAEEGASFAGYSVTSASEFDYTDPVDGSESKRQGLRFTLVPSGAAAEDKSSEARAVFRLSGTGSAGATIRLYLESRREGKEELGLAVDGVVGEVAKAALELSKLTEFTGREEPTVIT